MEHILQQEDGKARYLQHVSELSKSFSLAVPHEKALEIRDDVGFFQAVRAAIIKTTVTEGRPQEQLDTAVKQILSKAVVPSGVIDVYSVLGLEKPVISILSPEFLEEVRGVQQKNLAFEVLRKLLNDEIRTVSQRNVVQGRSFADMLEKSIKRYQNKSIQTAQVIEELIGLAKQMREAQRRGEELGLSPAELAFYDALETHDSAVQVLGDDILRTIAQELVETVRNNVTIDWTLRENAQALLRVKVKRVLKKFGYPPDMQKKATETVLEQAALICGELAEA
jgi:type I restriction enzyme R subunit